MCTRDISFTSVDFFTESYRSFHLEFLLQRNGNPVNRIPHIPFNGLNATCAFSNKGTGYVDVHKGEYFCSWIFPRVKALDAYNFCPYNSFCNTRPISIETALYEHNLYLRKLNFRIFF